MKRILSLLLVLLLSISLMTGCNIGHEQDVNTTIGNTDNTQESNSDTQESSDDLEDNDEAEGSSKEASFTTLSDDLVDKENVMSIIEELSSEKYLGRLSGTEGNQLAVNYVADYFKELGLENPEAIEDYKQYFTVPVRFTKNEPILAEIDDNGNIINEYKFLEDFNPSIKSGLRMSGTVEGETYYISSKSEINKDNEQIKDKILVIPMEVFRVSGFSSLIELITSSDISIKGAIVEMDFMIVSRHVPKGFTQKDDAPICAYFNPESFSDMVVKAKAGAKVRLSIDYSLENVEVPNVIGVLPGTDEELKDEYIIICGHLDHVGDNKNGTYNPGALDNASGTASVMEIARILTTSKVKPKKTIIFIGFNGEEEGLYGSYYYVDNPLYSLENTTVINLDMVGSKRILPLSISTASTEASVGRPLRMEIYEYAKELGISTKLNSSEGSDHAPFNYKGVQAVLLIHADGESGYHTPGDTIETVDGDRIKEVIKLVLYYLDKNAY